MILTQKETMLLQDLKTQEQVCIEKYNQYAERANYPKLSQLLRTISSAEQQHLSTLEQMEKGTVPAMGGGQKQPFQPPASAPARAEKEKAPAAPDSPGEPVGGGERARRGIFWKASESNHGQKDSQPMADGF